MRPRAEARGNYVLMPWIRRWESASMRPRAEARGNGDFAAGRSGSTTGFNEASRRSARKPEMGTTATGKLQTLQ